ncbi:MAG: hypothetical protein M5U26_11085 [Planctomycetota bacterium]|nr:hypothetical protein [Planctomycetota bacterium]
MKSILHLAAVCLFIGGALACAEDLPGAPVEDAVKLTKAGLGDEVLLAWIGAHKAYARVGTDQIVALKEAQVSEKVIAALVRRGGQAASGTVEKVAEYDLPATTSTRQASRYVSESDYERAKTEYTSDEASRYQYNQPAGSVYYASDSYYAPSSYISVGYSSYPYSWYYPRYYGNYYYGGYYRPYYRSCYYPSRYHGYYGSGYRYYSNHGYYGRAHYSSRRHCR